MTKAYYKTPTPIDQAEIIPFSEQSKLYHDIIEGILELEKLYPRGPAMVKSYIDISIEHEQAIAKKKFRNAEIIPFKGRVYHAN